MRKIKFRAIGLAENDFVYGSYIHRQRCKGESNEHQIVDSNGVFSDIAIETLGQYTGQSYIDEDKDEIYMYEGDVCEVVYYNHGTPNYKVLQFVSFEDGTFTLNSKKTDSKLEDNLRSKCPLFSCYPPNKIKVIGNIHQNKDLLK